MMSKERLCFSTTGAQNQLSHYLWSSLSHLCYTMDRTVTVEPSPFINVQKDRNAFTVIDTFSICVVLFYCVVLSELYQDKRIRTELLLWSLGVSPTEQMIAWYISQILQAMVWSMISMVQLVPFIFTMATNIVFLWFCMTLVFFGAAILALISAKFVRGTMSYLFAIFQMMIIWLFSYIWTQTGLPLPTSQVVRNLLLLHPITQALNWFKLAQSAEFSREGLSLSTLTSTFNMKQHDFFGTGLETLLLILTVAIVCSILFLVNFKYFLDLIRNALNLDTLLLGLKQKPHANEHLERFYERYEMSTSKPPIVEVKNLSMSYPNGFQALTDVSFSIYPGEILGLLGKNGAGKSTTMNIISGFYEASEGFVKVGGIDLSCDRIAALNNLSFCPQDDRFFYRLTVTEHLKLVCRLKNAKYNSERADWLLKFLQLTEKRDTKPRNVSGGQKRRVCIAMAYIANSPLVILDEPTSAVDAATRKTLWSFFQAQQKANPQQSVILCTHFMQEADVLSQRIAIISEGQLKAIGSSTYLKSLFGVGYTFTYEKAYDQKVRAVVSENCAKVKFPSSEENGTFQVPMELASFLPAILKQLDTAGLGYSFNAATLENVFVSLSTKTTQSNCDSKADAENAVLDTDFDEGLLDLADNTSSLNFENNPSHIWFLNQLKFSFYVDFLRIFVENWIFFVVYTIFFFAFPQVVMLLCNLDDSLFTSENIIQNGNITVTPATISKNPKVAIFGQTFEPELSNITNILSKNGVTTVTNKSLDTILDEYLDKPGEIFNTYPFFLNFTDGGEVQCAPNNHFQSSSILCVLLLMNLYMKPAFLSELPINVSVVYFEEEVSDDDDGSSYLYADYEEHKSERQDQCKGTIFYFLEPIIYFCLLFFILRVEASRNEVGLSSFYRANGAHPLFAFTYRLITLFFIIFAYFFAIVILTEQVPYVAQLGAEEKIPSYKLLDAIALFSFAFACFAILVTKFLKSVIVQLLITFVSGVIYFAVFSMGDAKKSLLQVSNLFWILVAPLYSVPINTIPILLNSEQKTEKVAIHSWAIQLSIFFVLIFMIESMAGRIVINAISALFSGIDDKCDENESQVEGSESSQLAIHGRKVYHTYRQLSVGVCSCCKGDGCALMKRTRALRGMRLNVKKGECYALLGVNGAGKSTLFEILTGGNRLQKGSVSISGKSVAMNPLAVLKDIGYCSQMDKVPKYLKVSKIIELFGQMRGLSKEQIQQQMDYMVRVLDVSAHMSKLLGRCSGGTKRKVSTMVAFIGFPKLIILDESTTGIYK